MALTISLAEESDAERIADIHMAAFGTNEMLLAQFPTVTVRNNLRLSLVRKVIDEIQDPQWAILVVRDQKPKPNQSQKQNDQVVSFAKWCLPILLNEETGVETETETYVEPPWHWPEGTNLAVLDGWTKKVEDANRRILGRTPCYRLSFIGTDPQYERRGAASMLINWGLEHGKRENVPVALESTRNAWPLYERLGFEAEEEISMVLESIGDDGASTLYEEKCFVFRPSRLSCSASVPTKG